MEKVMSILEMAIWAKKHLPNFGKNGGDGRGGIVRKKKSFAGIWSTKAQHRPVPVLGRARHKAVTAAERTRFKAIFKAGVDCGQVNVALALAAHTNHAAESAVAILRGESGFTALCKSK